MTDEYTMSPFVLQKWQPTTKTAENELRRDFLLRKLLVLRYVFIIHMCKLSLTSKNEC